MQNTTLKAMMPPTMIATMTGHLYNVSGWKSRGSSIEDGLAIIFGHAVVP